MANIGTITVTDTTTNGWTALPTAGTFDTGTVAVTDVVVNFGGETDRGLIFVTNTAAASLVVQVQAGDYPPAFRSGIGNSAAGTIAGTASAIFGPFESAQFGQSNQTVLVTLTPASGTIAATAYALKLPKA